MAVGEQRLAPSRARKLSLARIWQGLRSMTFAIIMLTLILCVVIAGSVLPQDSGIRYVYHSWWFYGLNFLLMASVLSCASKRIRPVFRYAFAVPVVHRPEFYRAGPTVRELQAPLGVDEATTAAVTALRRLHYRVEVQQKDGCTYILADRFRAMRLGSLLSHLSIVLMVASIAWGALAGWLDQTVMLEAGGAPVAVGHGTGLQIRSDSFDYGLYPNGQPSNFRDHLTVIEPSGAEQHQTIDVNTPWYYGGIFGYDIHQASYGVSARLIAIDTRAAHPATLGYCVLEDGMQDCTTPFAPLLLSPAGDGSFNPVGNGLAAFYMPQQDLAVTLTFHDPVPADNLPATASITVVQPPQKAGQSMRILREQADIPVVLQKFDNQEELITSQPITVNGVRFALLIRRMAGLNIGHNPAVPFIFTSFVLILLGLISVLYFPFTRLWLYVARQDSAQAGSVVWMRGSAEKSKQGFKRRFDLIGQRVQQQLQRAVSARSAGVQES